MRLWDVAAGTCREISGDQFGDSRFIRGIFSPNGEDMTLLTGDLGATGACRVDVVDVASGSEVRHLGFGASSSLVIFSRDGKTMITVSLLGLIHFYDTTSQIKQNTFGHDRRLTALKPLPDGKLVTVSHDRTVKLWNVERSPGSVRWRDMIMKLRLWQSRQTARHLHRVLLTAKFESGTRQQAPAGRLWGYLRMRRD